jgi:uncharacterized protein YbaR (Trm112 family)
VCGRKYHNCPSCCTAGEEWWDYGSCSEECWQKLYVYVNDKRKYLLFYNSLTTEQQRVFDEDVLDIIEQYGYESHGWCGEPPEEMVMCYHCREHYKISDTTPIGDTLYHLCKKCEQHGS